MQPVLPASTEFDFVEVLDHGPCYEYIVLVTKSDLALSPLAQAEPLSPEAIRAILLSVAFGVWLRGKPLHPVVEGNPM